MSIQSKELIELLLTKTKIPKDLVDYANDVARASDEDLDNIVLRENLISDDALIKLIADYLKTPIADISINEIDQEAYDLISESIAKKFKTIAFAFSDQKKILKVACSQPLEPAILKSLHEHTKKKILPHLASRSAIKRALSLYSAPKFLILRKKIDELKENYYNNQIPSTQEILLTIFRFAKAENLLSLTFHQTYKNVIVRVKNNDNTQDLITLPLEIFQTILYQIETSAHFYIRSPHPQQGRFKTVVDGDPLSIKAIFTPSYHGSNLTLIFTSADKPMKFSQLGMSDHIINAIKKNFQKETGILLIVSPPVSGKTTTFYSALNYLNKSESNISTIEENIEYPIDRINQTQVNPELNIGFYSGLKAIANQDPDIIGVGELVGPHTANLALQYAHKTQQIIATMPAESAVQAISVLLKMNIEPHLIASTNNLIVAQKLIKKNCPFCLTHHTISYSEIEPILTVLAPDEIRPIINLEIIHSSQKLHLAKGRGCRQCYQTGYIGLIPVSEALQITPRISELILHRATSTEINDVAIEGGFRTIVADALHKAVLGLIRVEDVFELIKDYRNSLSS